jgi:ribosomal protein L11 methyltransferase
MPSLALRVELAQRAAEAVSEALLESGAYAVDMEGLEGPVIVLNALFPGTADVARALGRALESCGVAGRPDFSVRQVCDEDWVRRSQLQFEPTRIGRLWVGATWHERPASAVALHIDPGLAFGTGSHVTTRLMLGFLDRTINGGERVLDYGCGSGVLAIAAAKLGAARADAVDIDPTAVEVARDNARANAAPVNAYLPEALPPGRYDVLVANILAQPLIELAPLLASRARRGAAIALAGLLASQAREVGQAYARDFEMQINREDEGWVLLCGARR